MLKKYEVSLVEEDLEIEDQLEDEILIYACESQGRSHFFLKTDSSDLGRAAITHMLKVLESATPLKVIASDKNHDWLKSQFKSNRQLTNVTYTRRASWKFNSSTGKLKLREDSKIRVLIVDDSKTIRMLLEKILSADSAFEIVGTIEDPTLVENALKQLKPDVMTLDIHMPKMTGIQLLQKIMPRMPLPVVMISSLGLEDGQEVVAALKLGAVDYIQKPSFDELGLVGPILIEKIK